MNILCILLSIIGVQLALALGLIAPQRPAKNLRSHGAAPENHGDIAYINQLEDDHANAYDSGRGLIRLGHSSGSGLVIRAANGALKGQRSNPT